jgi:hypothetical protein
MRSDLGRLDAIAEILQVGPFLGMIPKRGNRFSEKITPKQKDKRQV